MPILKILLLSKEIRMCTGRQNQRRRKIYTEFTEKIIKKNTRPQSNNLRICHAHKQKKKKINEQLLKCFLYLSIEHVVGGSYLLLEIIVSKHQNAPNKYYRVVTAKVDTDQRRMYYTVR